MDEVDKAMQTQGSGNLDALLGAVTQNFMDRKAEEAGPAGGAKDKPKDDAVRPAGKAGKASPAGAANGAKPGAANSSATRKAEPKPRSGWMY